MSAAREPGLAAPARWIFAAALGLYLAIAAWLVWRTSILEPYSDMFDWIARHERFRADGDLGRYLWAPHNFHHLVWTFAILDLDTRAFGASSYLFLAMGVLCLAGTAALLACAAGAAAGRGLRLIGAGGAVALSAMGCHVLDASADINTTYLHALVFAVAAIVLATAPGERAPLRRGGVLICAVAAGLGSAAGLAVWPALLLVAWRAGDRRWAVAVVITGIAFSLIYLLGQAAPASPMTAGGLTRLAEAVALFVNYLGLPWVRGIPGLGWLVGVMVLGLSLAALIGKGGRDAAWPERTALGLILFSLTTAVMAGVARTGATAADFVPMRYAVFLIPLQVGLWILALPYLRRAWERRPRPMEGLVVGAAALMLVHQGLMAAYAVSAHDTTLALIADFRAGQRSAAMLPTIYPDLAKAQALSDRMRRQGLYQRELRPDPPPAQRIGYFGFMD
ncbi:hypothetical protein [Phenylobacterium sp.]|uniref:hypothetical protein n=1 Tax=Phenylobacterium sp. TaxID=1871053 RepID=UPI0035663B86